MRRFGGVASRQCRQCELDSISEHVQFWATVYKTVRPVLSDCCLSVSLPVLSVTLVYCGQTVGQIKMKLGKEVGLGPGHIVLDGTQLPSPKGGHSSPPFSAHAYCGYTAGWIKMPLGTEVSLGPGDVVLDAPPPTERGTAAPSPLFGPLCSGMVAHLSCCWSLVKFSIGDSLV